MGSPGWRLLTGCVGAAALLGLLSPLLRNDGLAKGNDVLLHVGNVVECAHLLEGGRLPPYDWLPDIAGGRGGPNYLYYGSLGFIPPAVLVLLGLEPEDSLRLWTSVVFVLGFVCAWFLGALHGGTKGGLVCAVLFIYGPYYHTLP